MMAKKRTKRKYPLPEKRIKFENEIDILKGVVEFSDKGDQPVSYKDIKIGLSPSAISSELTFLESINIINKEKWGKYLPNQEAIEFVNNLNLGNEKEAKKILRNILINTWFGKLAFKLLNIKKECDINTFISELGKESAADPKKDKKAVKKLVEWLKYAEIIEIGEDNQVKLKVSKPTKEAEKEIVEMARKEEKAKSEEDISRISINITFLIQVNSQTKEDDIKKLIQTIKDIIQEIKR